MKEFLIVVTLSADYDKKLHQKACRTCSTIFFFIEPIKSLICGVVVDVAVVKS